MAIPLFGFGYILKYFKKFKIHNFAESFMGFALLFMGLGLLKESLTLGPGASRKRLEAGADVKEELNYIDIVRKIERAGDCVYAIISFL